MESLNEKPPSLTVVESFNIGLFCTYSTKYTFVSSERLVEPITLTVSLLVHANKIKNIKTIFFIPGKFMNID